MVVVLLLSQMVVPLDVDATADQATELALLLDLSNRDVRSVDRRRDVPSMVVSLLPTAIVRIVLFTFLQGVNVGSQAVTCVVRIVTKHAALKLAGHDWGYKSLGMFGYRCGYFTIQPRFCAVGSTILICDTAGDSSCLNRD